MTTVITGLLNDPYPILIYVEINSLKIYFRGVCNVCPVGLVAALFTVPPIGAEGQSVDAKVGLKMVAQGALLIDVR